MKKIAQKLIDFIEKSPTAYQTVEEMKKRLLENNYKELSEKDRWELQKGNNYFVTRNDSSLIAFSIPNEDCWKFHIMVSHTDSPAFKVKENPEITVENVYVKLNVEKYGSPILSPWLDRPLSVAGRVIVEEDGKIISKNIQINKDLLVIPNVAIHMNREINNGYVYNLQKDLLPLYSGNKGKSFMELIAETANVDKDNILSHDLFLYNRTKGMIWGPEEELLSAPHLDDLECAFASLEAHLEADKKECIAVHCVLDNEEVGSSTKQGAASTFLKDTLKRINMCLLRTQEEYMITLANSFMISADNAHALHPNHIEKADPVNRPTLNHGIVIKYNANQKYCTDAVSAAIFKQICNEAQVPYQVYVNRSDIPGGSTLGNIANNQTAMNTIDIGLPQLAMHSCYETSGTKDIEYLVKAGKVFFK